MRWLLMLCALAAAALAQAGALFAQDTLRLAQAILLPEQRQGHAGATQLGVHPRPIRQWPLLTGHRRGQWEQVLFQFGIGQRAGPG